MSDPGLLCKANRAKDPASQQPLEQKHLPVIEVTGEVKSGHNL